ncbi:MAG TPA: DUF6785 family protein [Armatimonadota bacterium]|nr:DUF6785 family protein [Armatimonadota bacterium]
MTQGRGRRESRGWWARSIVFGAVCVVLVVVWIVFSEVPGKVFISSWSIVVPGILLLAVFVALRRLVPHALARRRLLLMYAMLSASSCMVGYGAIQALYPAVAAQFYNATDANQFDLFNKYVPQWLAPRSQDVLQGLFRGHSAVPWHAWIIPMIAWGTIWILFAFAMIALSILVSHAWIHEERLTFPIVQLPLEMTTEQTRLYRNGLLWFGFAIPLVLESLLALNYYAPSIPAIQMKHVDYSAILGGRPWNAMAPLYIGFTPFIVGFAYLAPTDISFSIFFFGILDRLIQVATVAMGGEPASGYLRQAPFSQQQTIGAFLVFAITPLVRAWPGIRRRASDRKNRAERGALGLLGVSALCILAFLHAIGLSIILSGVVIVLMLLIATALSRIRAEAGPAWAFGPFGGLAGNLVNVTGTASYSTAELANLSTMQWMSADLRFLPMPFHVESLKIGDSAGIPRRTMILALMIATVLGVATGLVAVLYIEYQLGVASGKVYGGVSYWQTLVTSVSIYWTTNHTTWDTAGAPWIAVGALITWGLGAMRQNFLWWPFHPVGYVLAHTGTGYSFWSHYLIAWAAKSLVLRYGGNDLYRRSVPFVIGLILGDILTQTVWSVGAVLLGAPVYQFIS